MNIFSLSHELDFLPRRHTTVLDIEFIEIHEVARRLVL